IGVDDPEVFAEQISFVETRDYVRIIQRNVEIYRALYGDEISSRAQALLPVPSPEQVTASQDQPM
ncbi:MAG TPA: hypothetical protein VD930_06675, partial [Gemmatimonadales bacterium]|nr:hypothetical protein [Gemmatimonadales bacterium]